MTDKQRIVYKGVKTLGPITPHQLAKRLGYSESSPIMYELLRLLKHSLLTRTGKGKLTKYQINEKFK